MRACLVLILCAGCDLLFPELANQNSPDAVDSDGGGGGSPHISGVLCALGDLRDYRSCGGTVSPEMRVTAEETRDGAAADSTGHFTLPLSKLLGSALLAAADGTNHFTPTITTVALSGGSADGLAVPIVPAQLLRQVALENGVVLDARKGVIFGWATDVKGTPLANLAATAPTGADGPFYDGAQSSQIGPSVATAAHGLVAFFNVSPGDARFTVGATQFVLPVRENALSLSLLITATP